VVECTVCRIGVRDLGGRSLYRPGGTLFPDYRGTVWRYTERCIQWAESQFISTVDACNNWSSSAYLMGTIPSLLLILTRYGRDPEGGAGACSQRHVG
jgi:hypothetical protein